MAAGNEILTPLYPIMSTPCTNIGKEMMDAINADVLKAMATVDYVECEDDVSLAGYCLGKRYSWLMFVRKVDG